MKPRDLASLYARSLFLGSASLLHVLAVVLGVGVYAAAATLLGLSLPVAIVVVVLVVFVAGNVGALRIAATAERHLGVLTTGEVAPAHRDQLHELLVRIFKTVWAGQPADYGDAYDGEPHNRNVFAAHFPDLAIALDDWDVAVERKAESGPALGDAFTSEATRRGLPTDEYDEWDNVEKQLAQFLVERAMAGNIGAPFQLNLSYINYQGVHGPNPGPGRELEVTLGGKPIAHLPADPADTRDARYTAIVEQLNELARAIADGAEATEIYEADQAIEPKKLGLRDEINAWRRVSVLRVSGDCSTCRRNLNLTEPVAPGSEIQGWGHTR